VGKWRVIRYKAYTKLPTLEIMQFLEKMSPDVEACFQMDADMGQECPGQLLAKI
jgi:hypothetical protein